MANIYNSKSVRRWTQTAMECYKRGCVCSGCSIYEQIFGPEGRKCQMKGAVLESVRKLGIPEELIKTQEQNIKEE